MLEMTNNPAYQFKYVLVGDPHIGKSSILSRFTRNEFSLEPKITFGIEIAARTAQVNKIPIKLQVWDACGQEEGFQEIERTYFRGAMGVLIAFDVSVRTTFENVGKWVEIVRQNAEEGAAIILVGNKSDLNFLRQVTVEEASNYAERQNMMYFETSALNGSNVEDVFQALTAEIYKTFLESGGLDGH